MQNTNENYKENNEVYVEKIEYFQEVGKQYIIEKKHKAWDDTVYDLLSSQNANDIEVELTKSLELLEILGQDNETAIYEAILSLQEDKYQDNEYLYTVLDLIARFSSNGVKFVNTYISIIKDNKNERKFVAKLNKLVEFVRTANKYINKGIAAELILHDRHNLYYMPIITKDSVKDILLIDDGEGVYEGTYNDNMVVVREDGSDLVVRFAIGDDHYCYITKKNNEPVAVNEYCNDQPTGNRALIYFKRIQDPAKAVRQVVLNEEVFGKTNMTHLVRSYQYVRKEA